MQGFSRGPGNWATSLHALCGSGEGLWPGCVEDIVGAAAGVWGEGVITQSSYFYMLKARAMFELLAVGLTCFRWALASTRAVPCHQSYVWFSWTGFQGIVMGSCSLVGWRLHHFRFAAEFEADGMISTSKSEAMVLGRKPADCPLQVESESLSRVTEFKYLRVLFTSEGTMEQEIGPENFCSGSSFAFASTHCCDKKRGEPEG